VPPFPKSTDIIAQSLYFVKGVAVTLWPPEVILAFIKTEPTDRMFRHPSLFARNAYTLTAY